MLAGRALGVPAPAVPNEGRSAASRRPLYISSGLVKTGTGKTGQLKYGYIYEIFIPIRLKSHRFLIKSPSQSNSDCMAGFCSSSYDNHRASLTGSGAQHMISRARGRAENSALR